MLASILFCSPYVTEMEARKRKLIYEPEQNTLLWRTFTITLSTLLDKGDFNRGRDRIQTPGFFFFSTTFRTGHTKQWRAFHSLPSQRFSKWRLE